MLSVKAFRLTFFWVAALVTFFATGFLTVAVVVFLAGARGLAATGYQS